MNGATLLGSLLSQVISLCWNCTVLTVPLRTEQLRNVGPSKDYKFFIVLFRTKHTQ